MVDPLRKSTLHVVTHCWPAHSSCLGECTFCRTQRDDSTLVLPTQWHSLTASWHMFHQRAVSQCWAGPSSLRQGPLGCASCGLPPEGSSPCRCGHRGSAGVGCLESSQVWAYRRGREREDELTCRFDKCFKAFLSIWLCL